ncbi:MAG: biotin transporter BioY [Cyanobacteria bacterium SZAS TMP-1]|nr:biotin transporter BioY [Cyanobacteria bacterium SZAS TMP-1]
MRLVSRQSSVPRIRRKSIVGPLVLILLGTQLLFLASFTSFDVPIATKRNFTNFLQRQLRYVSNAVPRKYYPKVEALVPALKEPVKDVRRSSYTPLVAVAIFLGYVLGPIIGPVSCAVFVVIGMLGPFAGVHAFAGGGGLNYYIEPGFGYLLSLIGASWIAGAVTIGKRTTASQLFAVFSGLTVTHLTGLVYLLGSCLVSYLIDGSRASLAWQPWVFELARNMTWYPLPYDLVSSLVLIGLGFPFRFLALSLIAPDLMPKAVPAKNQQKARPQQAGLPAYQTEIIEEFV